MWSGDWKNQNRRANQVTRHLRHGSVYCPLTILQFRFAIFINWNMIILIEYIALPWTRTLRCYIYINKSTDQQPRNKTTCDADASSIFVRNRCIRSKNEKSISVNVLRQNPQPKIAKTTTQQNRELLQHAERNKCAFIYAHSSDSRYGNICQRDEQTNVWENRLRETCA